MGKPSAPAAPDPKETAAASTGTNVATAIANAGLNSVDQVTPDGSLTYETIGYESFTDPYSGQTYQIPKRRATQTLSEANQAIKTNSDQAGINLSGLANDQSAAIRDRLNTPFEFNNQDAADWAYDIGASRLNPELAARETSLRTTLANKGIREGSAAWNAEMSRLTQAENDARNNLALSGREMAYSDALDQYTLPINTITALLSGSQVSDPNYVNAPQSTIPTTDVGGIINQDYANRFNAYNSQMNQWNSVAGGLMGLGGKLIGLSDKRAKKDIKKVGEVNGMGLYDFKYRGSDVKHRGLIAQDVEKKKPQAVITGPDGLKRVDYGAALGLMGA
jgi:hypothetical protein